MTFKYKIISKNKDILEKLKVSRTKSLEKKPLKLGKPSKFNSEIDIVKQEKGV